MDCVLNSLPASGDLCRLLMVFANIFDQDHARQNLDPNCLHSDSAHERFL